MVSGLCPIRGQRPELLADLTRRAPGTSADYLTVDLPQAKLEAPIALGATGKINVHVSVGTKAGKRTEPTRTASLSTTHRSQTNIHPAK